MDDKKEEEESAKNNQQNIIDHNNSDNNVIAVPPKSTNNALVYAAINKTRGHFARLANTNQTAPKPPGYYTTVYPQRAMTPGMMYFQNPLIDFAHWAPYPASIPPNVPPGLAHLLAADCVLVMQQVGLIELMLDWQQSCKFMVLNAEGYCIFYAYETSGLWTKCCCQDSRPLQIHVRDMYQNETIYMNRLCGCAQFPCLCQCCCLTAMEVYLMPFTPIGAIIGHSTPGSVLLDIVDVDENLLFHVQQDSGCLCVYCFYEAEFAITALDANETEIGLIRKQWGGMFREFLSGADVFTVNFPQDMDVKIKALFLGAMFLINYLYYED